ncbi:MAG: hypothetical protein KIT83_15345 [Bryobacterales bacterium]|nr:hypothetical protein [Bryobacterales bacterium]
MKIALLCLSTLFVAGLAMVSVSCAKPEDPQPEPPPTRGQRDRAMSELHGSRKLFTDAMAAMGADAFVAPGENGAPSPAAKVEALVQLERTLQVAMQNSTVGPAAHPMEQQEGLSREERQKRNEEAAASMRTVIAACLDKYPDSAWAPSGDAAKPKADLEATFREARDATIAYARETEHNFLRRQVEFPNCGTIDLMTAMMAQAELTAKVSETLR